MTQRESLKVIAYAVVLLVVVGMIALVGTYRHHTTTTPMSAAEKAKLTPGLQKVLERPDHR